MTTAPDSDATLLARLAAEVGCDSGLLRWHFLGSTHGPCRVWHVTGPGGEVGVVVKQFRSDRAFAQERHAYERWLTQLPEETAALLAVLPAPVRALVLRKVPGEPLQTGRVTEGIERAAHRRAGYFLRALHGLAEPDDDAMPLRDAVQRRYAAWLERVGPLVAADERDRLRELGEAPRADPELFAGSRRVPCHRDFTPRNWLIDGPLHEGQISRLDSFFVVDFEHAHLDCPLLDIVKLWTEVWGERPDLEVAFFAGYGRLLRSDELIELSVLAAMHAMATVAWAHDHADLTFQAAGDRALRRVLG